MVESKAAGQELHHCISAADETKKQRVILENVKPIDNAGVAEWQTLRT
jgi:hypothetical protein